MAELQRTLLALGANLPREGIDLGETLLAALAALASPQVTLLARSRLYSTPCFPPGAGPDYVNAAAVLTTRLAPQDLLSHLHRIEAEFGRERVQRWGQRTLDLDLIAMGDLVLPDAATQDHWRALPPEDQRRLAPDRLILPHPRLQDRAFVLVPLAEIAPDWRHPRLQLTVRQMLDRLDLAEIAAVKPL
jgi:2-amino-4-hydroxy-6-hydroxymethyldihydropteridine diphosphokinase